MLLHAVCTPGEAPVGSGHVDAPGLHPPEIPSPAEPQGATIRWAVLAQLVRQAGHSTGSPSAGCN